jgi:hypothetical protein
MSSTKYEEETEERASTAKLPWQTPSVGRLEAGEADASDGVGPDGLGFVS